MRLAGDNGPVGCNNGLPWENPAREFENGSRGGGGIGGSNDGPLGVFDDGESLLLPKCKCVCEWEWIWAWLCVPFAVDEGLFDDDGTGGKSVDDGDDDDGLGNGEIKER